MSELNIRLKRLDGEKMKHFDHEALNELPARFRAHFINSVTGYKSASLIGSVSPAGDTNLAIFSSVIHLGSNPPMLGFLFRPLTVERHTYRNIKETGECTVNHVHAGMIREAHQTSAKYDDTASEFSSCGFTEEYLDGCKAPYVKESRVKMACSYLSEHKIEENGCIFMVAAIKTVYVDEDIIAEDGWLNLEKAETAVITGQDAYAKPVMLDRFSYAEPGKEPESLLQ